MVAQRLQHLARADAWPWRAIGHGVALSDGVLEPKLQWVQPELPCQLVHLPLDGKARLRHAGGTIGSGARLVGQHVVAVDQQVGKAIGAAEQRAENAGGAAGIGARVHDRSGL